MEDSPENLALSSCPNALFMAYLRQMTKPSLLVETNCVHSRAKKPCIFKRRLRPLSPFKPFGRKILVIKCGPREMCCATPPDRTERAPASYSFNTWSGRGNGRSPARHSADRPRPAMNAETALTPSKDRSSTPSIPSTRNRDSRPWPPCGRAGQIASGSTNMSTSRPHPSGPNASP